MIKQNNPIINNPCTMVVNQNRVTPSDYLPPKAEPKKAVRRRKTDEEKKADEVARRLKKSNGVVSQGNYYVTVFNNIKDYFNKGLWILAIEYTYNGIKQSLNHCSKKINPTGYTDLYNLKSHFFNHVTEKSNQDNYLISNDSYLLDLINTTYVLLLDHFTTSNSHMLTTERAMIENLAYEISRQAPADCTNYGLHMFFCNLYHKIFRLGYKSLSKLQYSTVKKVRANYRLKDDIISRLSAERRLMVGFDANLQECIQQSNAINGSDLQVLLKDINGILDSLKPPYQKIFKLKIQGKTFGEISNMLGYSNESGSRKTYNKVIAILRLKLNLEKYQCYHSIDIYNLTSSIDIID